MIRALLFGHDSDATARRMAEKTLHEITASDNEKDVKEVPGSPIAEDVEVGHDQPASLTRGLQGRHMQMIAIGEHMRY